tara:strand:- start:218 stop:424 length:207 start_codon:yes stop_codon:yes gene_type:complete
METAVATSLDNAPPVTHFYAYSTSVMSLVIVLGMTIAMLESNAWQTAPMVQAALKHAQKTARKIRKMQ